MIIRCRTFVAPFVLSAVLSGCAPATAGYFGQNEVRYDDFDFKILQTERFDIFYYEEEAEAIRDAGRMAERWYARLSTLLSHDLSDRQVMIYYASHPHFQQTQTIGGAPGEGTGGVTEALKRRVVLPFAGPLKETDHVTGHELVHAFQFDMTDPEGGITTTLPMALRLPLWFIEGMAEYLSVGPNDPHTAMWIRDAAVHDRIPTMEQLNDPRFFPYRFGQAFWAYIAGRFGDEVVGRILNTAARGAGASQAIERVLGIPADTLNAEWQVAIHQAYDGIREITKEPSDYGPALLSRENSGFLNSSPALSHDGSQIAFISERDRTSIDLFVADAVTGELLGKLIETATDGHLASIQFLYSAGAWDTTGTQFVVAGVVNSDPALRLLEVPSGKVIRERQFPEIGEAFNPVLSPDGNMVAFSGMIGGFTDLFIYDVAADSLRRMTSDKFAYLHPDWSPDGTSIVVSTDRFSTDLARLRYGNYRLALVDVDNRAVRQLPSFRDAKNINPQWSRDGSSVFFVSDRLGISNLYRLDVSAGAMYQITNLYGGVSGITALSPAISTASHADKVAFGVYSNGAYNIHTIDGPEGLVGTRVGGDEVLGGR